MNNLYRGYVTSRSFSGFYIPVPLQSLALRDYCLRNNLIYVLPVNENRFSNSYLVLNGMIKDLKGYQGIIMYSYCMLPKKEEIRRVMMEKILKQAAKVVFVLEDLVISSEKEIAYIDELIAYSNLASINANK